MLLWWFGPIGDTMRYGDSELANHLVWHPLDHIHWKLARPAPNGGTGETSVSSASVPDPGCSSPSTGS
jgi:hypothetical protein